MRTGGRVASGVVGVGALCLGGWLAGGLPAVACGAAGLLALIAMVARPGWPPGPTLVAAALVGEVALADRRSGWSVWVAALLLAALLAVSESAQSGAWRAGWRQALAPHRAPCLAAAVGAGVVLACSPVELHGAALVSLVAGVAVAAGLLIVLVSRATMR